MIGWWRRWRAERRRLFWDRMTYRDATTIACAGMEWNEDWHNFALRKMTERDRLRFVNALTDGLPAPAFWYDAPGVPAWCAAKYRPVEVDQAHEAGLYDLWSKQMTAR